MSAIPAERRPVRLARVLASPRPFALAGGAVLTLSYLVALYHVVDVAGGPVDTGLFLLVVAGSLLLAAACVRLLDPWLAVGLATLLLLGGAVGYVLAVPAGSLDLPKLVGDTASLLSGMSVLRMLEADVWAIGLAPTPVFLSWYLLGRRAYGAGALAGVGALAFLVLTGDVGTVAGLVGFLGAAATVGFGRLDREGTVPALRNTLVVVLVAMLVVTTSASLVPGGEARPLLPDGESTTVEGSLTENDAQVEVLGSISLSSAVRFTVESSRTDYWRAGAYDRYTGEGWVRTGDALPYSTWLDRPPAERVRPVQQTFVAESTVSTMPAVWKPVHLTTGGDRTRVTELGGLRPEAPLQPGDRYRVTSLAPIIERADLEGAGTDYPPAVEARYLALPESTPARLTEFTDELTADADTPFQKATVIERWLRSNKAYSLDVSRPDGDVASSFVFEMDAGYCTYFATAMVAMLRTQGVPARFVVGYLPGQQVGPDEYVVRGYDSHAWVEVYFPDTGWVRFDPTPAGPREAAERERLAEARANGESNVDTNASARAGDPTDPAMTPAWGISEGLVDGNATSPAGTPNGSLGGATDPSMFGVVGAGGGGESGPSSETLLYGAVLLIGAATAVHRLGWLRRLYRAVWLRRLPDGPPATRVEAAVERGEYLIGERYRHRRPGETWRDYVAAIGEGRRGAGDPTSRAAALFRLGERARYAGRATELDAREAARLVAELRAENGRIG